MDSQYWNLLGGIAPVFIIITAGFMVRRLGWLTAESDKSLLRITINVLYPCLIYDSIMGNSALDNIGNVVLAPTVGFVTVAASLALCALAARVLPLDKVGARTFAFTAGIYNYGYIPVPLVQKFFGRETMGMLFAHNLGVEIAFWTVGIYTLTHASSRKGNWREMLNAPVCAIIVSLILNFCHAHDWMPSFIATSAHMLAQSSIPVALLITGATFADQLLQDHPRTIGKAIVPACVMRLLVLPVIMLLITKNLPCSIELKRVLVILAAMPAAMLPVVLTKHYGGDSNVAVQVVLSTTLVGLLTIPWWIQWGMHFVGL
ncbi:MAG: AEC family transporter [Chthoniobacteraceae bacterium]